MAEFITLLLVIIIMLNGMAIIFAGPGMAGRLNSFLFRTFVARPGRALLRFAGNQGVILLRWSGRQLWALTRWSGRQLGRGAHAAWVRITS